MRVLIKKNDLYHKVAWIKRHSDGSILGWNSSPHYYIKNFPKNIDFFDIHYFYPKKGQFHFSYKYSIDKLTYHVRAYPKELSIKILGGIENIRTKNILLPKIEKFNEFIFLDNSANIDYNDPKLFRSLMATSFNIWTDNILQDVKKFGKKITPKETDIVLDIDELGKSSITYYPIIYNNTPRVNLDYFNSPGFIRLADKTQNPIIELIVNVSRKEQ
ncbi:MAG: hypothetical protein V4538_02545 [Bacteroidota bacterium]